jgi:hypothetical protein
MLQLLEISFGNVLIIFFGILAGLIGLAVLSVIANKPRINEANFKDIEKHLDQADSQTKSNGPWEPNTKADYHFNEKDYEIGDTIIYAMKILDNILRVIHNSKNPIDYKETHNILRYATAKALGIEDQLYDPTFTYKPMSMHSTRTLYNGWMTEDPILKRYIHQKIIFKQEQDKLRDEMKEQTGDTQY